MQEKSIQAFSKLGQELKSGLAGEESPLFARLQEQFSRTYSENGWFTEDNIRRALYGISDWLDERNLSSWAEKYAQTDPKRVGIVMAGNIPMVGFHDLLSVLTSGHKAVVKLSSSDKVLLPILMQRLTDIEADLTPNIEFVDKLKDFDAVIATGSNNTSRYFEYYFRDKPSIIRGNRNSMAVLSGDESEEELEKLGEDVFTYFGLGCRNVSKLLIPQDFDLDRIFGAFVGFADVAMNKKYANNYDYYKAIYILNKADLLENGFLLMKEDSSLHSPVSMLFYQRYSDIKEAKDILSIEADQLQCVVSHLDEIDHAVAFGDTQRPSISDYADGVDTMKFLSEI